MGIRVEGCEVQTGKVRDMPLFETEALPVCSDRLSGFDVVVKTPIPDKGRLLNAMTEFWYPKTAHIIQNCFLSTEMEEFEKRIEVGEWARYINNRSMLVRRATPLLIECVVRGFLYGSGLKDYKATGSICGIKLPEGMREADKFHEPIFTPSDKAPKGKHDTNITFQQACDIVGEKLARRVREISLELYKFAYDYALKRGIIIADVKFEFGLIGDQLFLIDEVFTCDSTRMWPVGDYEPGRSQSSFDKQYVRDYLQSLCDRGIWNKTYDDVPELPEEVVRNTTMKYQEALRIITGPELSSVRIPAYLKN